MLKVGIFGASGYAGKELINILFKHPKVKITYLSAKIDNKSPTLQQGLIPPPYKDLFCGHSSLPQAGGYFGGAWDKQNILNIFPNFEGELDTDCNNFSIKKAAQLCELVFLALPHTVSINFVPALLKKNLKVIDFSADYRFKEARIYEKWYKKFHKDKKNLKLSVYGLPELSRDKIKKANLIANPGCYPTAAILAIAPLLKEKIIDIGSIVIDAKSGYSGAGRGYFEKNRNDIVNNFKAYKVMTHQHTPEINQNFSSLAGKKVKVVFVPHLLPIERGILETIYLKAAKKQKFSSTRLINLYRNFYKNEPFVRIQEEDNFPQLKEVIRKNFCDLGIKTDGKNIVVIAAIDNLRKGAAGQAVQNMNIICGFKETEGLC